MFTETVTYPAAFLAGVLSFFSPCILPLIPAYFTFITGYSLDRLTGEDIRDVRAKVVLSTLAFVTGFSIVFILLGASASLLGGLVQSYSDIIRIGGGLLIVVLGIHLTGLVRLRFLDFEKRVRLKNRPIHIFGTLLVGMAFGAGWSPCIGPLLGSILIIAGNGETVAQGIGLLAVYSAGLALPFLAISAFIHLVLVFVRKISAAMRYVNAVAGTLLILVGIGLIFDKISL